MIDVKWSFQLNSDRMIIIMNGDKNPSV